MAANSPNSVGFSAANDLGLGSDLSQQVRDETDEQRKKRLQSMNQAGLSGPAAVTLLGSYGSPA